VEIEVDQKTKMMQILEKLEQGLIDVEEATRLLESEATSQDSMDVESERTYPESRIGDWWLIPLSFGLAATVVGAWLASLGGWWWLCAGPSLLAGMLLVMLASWSRRAPWIHVRMRTRRGQWPRRMTIHLPVPVGVAAWAVRTFGRHSDALDGTAIDELLMALEGQLSPETPLYIEVDKGRDGEQIQVTFG
jgi:hypothetical protein